MLLREVKVWSVPKSLVFSNINAGPSRSNTGRLMPPIYKFQSTFAFNRAGSEAPGELAELIYAIVGCVARMKSQRRSERTKAGLARVIAQGRKLGRPKGSRDKQKRKRRRLI